MDDSLDIDLIQNQIHLSPRFTHNDNVYKTYTIYKHKQTIMCASSIRKPAIPTHSYRIVDNKDLIGDPIVSCRKEPYTWWDCKLFDKKAINGKN